MSFSKYKYYLIILVILIFTGTTHAQGLPPFFDPEVNDNDPSEAPISGLIGIGILTGAGLIYRYRKEL